MTAIKPTHDNVLVKINKQDNSKETKTESGFIIPVNKNQPVEKESTGYVVATGQGRYLASGTIIPPCAKVGDKVMFNKFSGTEIEDGDSLYLLIKENDIIAIIE